MIATVLGLIGTSLGVLRSWPQVREIVCLGRAGGVSVHTWSLTLLNNATWLTLGLIIAAPPVVVSNALSATGCIAVLAAVARRRPDRSLPRAGGLALAGAALVAVVSRAGPTALTVLGTALAVSMFIPQLVTVLRSGAAGVSPSTWLVTAFSSGVWVLYAFALGRPPLAACHAVILPASLVIAERARRQPSCEEARTGTAAA